MKKEKNITSRNTFDIKEAYNKLRELMEQMEKENEKKENDVLLKKVNDLIKDKEIILENSIRRLSI